LDTTKFKGVLESLLRTRLSMLKMNDCIRQKMLSIPIHMALGHEAIAVAVAEVKHANDSVVLSHRNMHYNFAMTQQPGLMLKEYLLHFDGLMQGRYGSMNLIQPLEGIVYTSSILGNNLCVASGIAKANQIKDLRSAEPSVTYVVTGDGAMEEGAFYESLLMAKTCQVPMVVIVENNGWSMYTQIHERRCPIDLPQFGQSLSIPTYTLKGNDTLKYIEQLQEIRERALREQTPVIVEVLLHTLGDYWVEDPHRRNINYHHGLAPKIIEADNPVIIANDTDPIYVLKQQELPIDWQVIEAAVVDSISTWEALS
jgi:TPP-dependent pyruvate/acetoin dehydrogenase alpha subunit